MSKWVECGKNPMCACGIVHRGYYVNPITCNGCGKKYEVSEEEEITYYTRMLEVEDE